jgi:hypothetical protein
MTPTKDWNPVVTLTLRSNEEEGVLALSAGRVPLDEIEIDLWIEGMTKDESIFGSKHVRVSDVVEALAVRRALPLVLEALTASLAALQGTGSTTEAFALAMEAFDRLQEATTS